MENEIKAGDRIRVTRYRSDGKVHFVKTGAVVEVHGDAYVFNEDGGHSRRHWLAGDESLAQGMRGWSQTTERIEGGE
jgi:hypothetical protein